MLGTADASLLFRIKADSSDAQANLKKIANTIISETHAAGQGALSNLGIISTALNAIGSEAGVAVAGITAIVGAAAAASGAVLTLAANSASYASEIGKAEAKTGLTADSLSSLRYAAELSGKQLDEFTAVFPKFQKLLAEAAQGSDQAADKLQRLHIDKAIWNDQDKALEQLFNRINALQNPIERTKALQDAFGRSGADLSSVFRRVGGDFDAFKEKAHALGLEMGEKDVKAAKDYNTSMRTISAQLDHLKYTLGKELLPVITDVFRNVSTWIANNHTAVENWGKSIANVVSNLIDAFKKIIQFADDHPTLFDLMTLGTYSSGKRVAQSLSKDYGNGPTPIPQGPAWQSAHGAKNETDYDANTDEAKNAADDAKKARDEAYKRDIAAQQEHIKLMLDAQRSGFKAEQEDLEKHFEASEITADNYRQNTLENLKAYGNEARQLLMDQFKIDSEGKTGSEIANLKDARIAAEQAVMNEITSVRDDAQKRLNDATKKRQEESVKDAHQSYQNDVDNFESSQKVKLAKATEIWARLGIGEENLARKTEQIEEETLQHKIDAATKYAAAVSADHDAYAAALHDVKLLENDLEAMRATNAANEHKRQEQAKKDEQEVRAEKLKSWHQYIEQIERQHDLEDAEQQRKAEEEGGRAEDNRISNKGIGGGIAGATGARLPSILDDKGALKTQAEYIKGVYADIKGAAGDAIGSMVEGLGQLVTQWLVTGKLSGRAALQMASSIALGLAMQAGVKAIFELAEGWAETAAAAASAAVFDYRGAALHSAAAGAHYTAAGVYGTVAGIAAAVGVGAGLGARALGGGKDSSGSKAFNSASGTASGSTGGGAYSSQSDQTIEQNRNAPGMLGKFKSDITLRIVSTKDHIVSVVKENVAQNGQLRTLIQDTAG